MRHYHSYKNRRGNHYGAGMKSGCSAHTRGWHAGVEVYVGTDEADKNRDQFTIWMTGGSTGRHGSVLLGTVRDTAHGPAWEPGSLRTEALALAGMLPPDVSSLTEPEVRALRILLRQLRGWGRRLDERQVVLDAEAAEHAAQAAEWGARYAAMAELDAIEPELAEPAGDPRELAAGLDQTVFGPAGYSE